MTDQIESTYDPFDFEAAIRHFRDVRTQNIPDGKSHLTAEQQAEYDAMPPLILIEETAARRDFRLGESKEEPPSER